MNWRGINQIGAYLNQSGVPAGQSQDIVTRLRQMIEAAIAESKAYADGLNSGNQREFNSQDAKSDAFYNQFKTPEETGKGDGRTIFGGAGGFGRDGSDGEDGEEPDLSWLEDYIKGLLDDLLRQKDGLDFPAEHECWAHRRKMENCGCDSWRKMAKACSIFPPAPKLTCDEFGGRSPCSILAQMRETLRLLRKRVEKIEEELRNTVDCP